MNYRRLPRSAFIPLRVTARLTSPVVGDPSIPLDGLLYYHAMREQYGPQLYTEPGQDHSLRVTAVSLPILRHEEHTPLWYYACSWAQWPTYAQGMTHWNKRIDVEELAFLQPQRGRIEVKAGRYKAYHMPIFYRHAPTVHWFIRAEPHWLTRMLSFCTHIGKKTEMGWGEVDGWQVEQWEEDWSVRDPDGKLMRAVPADYGPLCGIRPSYWLPKNQTPCEVPLR